MPTAYVDSNYHTQNGKLFAEAVGVCTGGDLEIVVHGGGTLFKGGEIKRAYERIVVSSSLKGRKHLAALRVSSPVGKAFVDRSEWRESLRSVIVRTAWTMAYSRLRLFDGLVLFCVAGGNNDDGGENQDRSYAEDFANWVSHRSIPRRVGVAETWPACGS